MKYRKLIEETHKKCGGDLKKTWSTLKTMEIKKLIEAGSIKSQNEIIEVSNKMDRLLFIMRLEDWKKFNK